ncbi:MAG TPA: multidrug efflux SMR transporter [Jatrophihabitans sp.]|nr:multidrug efflux SMR transporter [Jatrophihabitans sp.]
MAWVYLALAIAAEVGGTVQLRALSTTSHRFALIVAVTVAYAASFFFMTFALRHIGVGAVYAIWSGVGTFFVALLGQLLYGDRIRWIGALGMVLIVGGVMLVVAGGSAHGRSGG